MRLLLTGGTGFIGSRLALHARRQQMEVTVAGQVNTDPERARLAELQAAGVAVLQGPLQQAEFARSAVAGCDTVIHLAAAQHEANVPDSYFREVNVAGTKTLLEASVAAGVKRFVYGSTIGVYGAGGATALDESTPPAPLNIYGVTKLEAEGVVKTFANQLETSIVRISETYGPGDFRLLKVFRGVDRGRFFLIGGGVNRRQVIHVNDLVRGLLIASEHPSAVGQTFVMAGHEIMTTKEMAGYVALALNRKPPSLAIPLWPFMVAAVVFEVTLKPLGIQPPLHRRRLDFFRKSFVFSTDKARQLLGFTPNLSFAEGAKETAAWYKAHNYLSN